MGQAYAKTNSFIINKKPPCQYFRAGSHKKKVQQHAYTHTYTYNTSHSLFQVLTANLCDQYTPSLQMELPENEIMNEKFVFRKFFQLYQINKLFNIKQISYYQSLLLVNSKNNKCLIKLFLFSCINHLIIVQATFSLMNIKLICICIFLLIFSTNMNKT